MGQECEVIRIPADEFTEGDFHVRAEDFPAPDPSTQGGSSNKEER